MITKIGGGREGGKEGGEEEYVQKYKGERIRAKGKERVRERDG